MIWLAVCLFFVGLAIAEAVAASIISGRAGLLEEKIRMNERKGRE